jgi:uncharacterized protein (DUF2236 family)
MLVAIFGDTEQVEAQRRGAWEAHSRLRGVDADGREWTANDPELTTRVYTVLVRHLLAAQERHLGPLGESERDDYCADAVRTVGYVFGTTPVLPATYAALSAEYAGIIANELTVTPQAHEVFEESRSLRVKDIPMEELVAATADLLDPEVAAVFGIDRSRAVELPPIDLNALTEEDLLPIAALRR